MFQLNLYADKMSEVDLHADVVYNIILKGKILIRAIIIRET